MGDKKIEYVMDDKKIGYSVKQIDLLCERLTEYENFLSGKIEKMNICDLCCTNCSDCLVYNCDDGMEARRFIYNFHYTVSAFECIKKWYLEMIKRANKRLEESGSWWFIEGNLQ